MKRMWLVLALATVFMLALVPSGHAALYTTPQNISQNDGYDDRDPQINNSGEVVWKGEDGTDWEIFLFDGTTVQNISQNDGYDDGDPQINNSGEVVWQGYRHDEYDWEIFLFDGTTVQNISQAARYNDHDPEINDSGVVVWYGWDGDDYEIYRWSSGTGVQNISQRDGYNDVNPQINNSGEVVWYGGDGNDAEIFLFDPTSGVTNISQRDGYDDKGPEINDSGEVVWWAWDENDLEIFLFDPTSETVSNISDNDGNTDLFPRLNNAGYVVWFGWDGDDYEIYLFDGADVTNISQRAGYDDVNPQINDSGKVVWYGYAENEIEIFLYDGATFTNISQRDGDDYFPRINDPGQVAWYGFDGNDDEIYLATPAPDLIVQSIVTDPVSPEPGETVDVTVTVKNQGAGDAAGYHIQFYKDRATAPGIGDFGDEFCPKGPLAAGAEDTCTVSVTYASAGTYEMWAQVDMQDWVAESDESNNVFGPQDIVVAAPAQPDLIVQSIATNPVSPAPGEVTGVTVTVKNQGAGEAVRAFSIDFYKDRPSAPGASDSGDVSCLRSGLATGATVACTWGVSYASPGTYKMWAQVDTGQTVEEVDEENNILGPQDIDVSLPTFVLSVTKAGTGQGTVTSNPSGIDCGADCSETYEEGTQVTLTATPDSGATFAGFSGDPDCTDATVTVDSAKSCTATFDDTTAPSIPQNVTITPTDVDKATLSWDASADTGGSGVSGYRVYDTKTGALVSETAQLSADLSGLAAEASYFVKAYDVAGNVSDRSRFASARLPVRFYWQTVDIAGKTFAANPAGATATASFIFEGDEVSINYGCGLNTGIFEVSIDGVLVDTVDAYCSPPDFSAKKTYLTSPGGHIITVRPTGTTNPSSSYFWTLLDSFEVAGETYQEDDGISYTWQTVDILGATFSANPAGGTAYVSFTYVGDSASINYGCGVNTGIFEVWMDAAVVEPVDAYCSPPDFSTKKTYPTAPSGTHTIEVRPTGTNNPSSSYFWTLIDSFETGGTVYQAQALPSSQAEELYIPKSRLSKLLQKLPKPLRERIEKRLEEAGGLASAETLPLLNSERLTRLLKRLEGKGDEE